MVEKTLKGINEEIEQLQKKEEELAKEQEQARVKEGLSICCKECKKYVAEPNLQEKETGVCYDCRQKRRREQQKQESLKMKGAVIVDVEVNRWGAIKKLNVVKHGFGFELVPESKDDYDESFIDIYEEGKREIPVELQEFLRPGEKPRPKNEQKITKYAGGEINV